MTFLAFGIAWLGFNLLFATLSAFCANRWGRDAFGWLLIGAVLGPFAFLVLLGLRRDDLRRKRPVLADTSSSGERRGIKALVAIDGSANSDRALDWIVGHLGGAVSEVTVATILPIERADAIREADDSPGKGVLQTEIEAKVESACRRLRTARIPCRPVTRFGEASSEILAEANDGVYDLIVVGRRGLGGVAKLVLGSVSEKVVKGAAQPVIVVD